MPKKILVVDDEEDLLEIVKSHVEEAGYTVFTAMGRKQGLELAKREKPHLIILDIAMPDMSGFEMLENIRGIKELWHTPVIMLTAQGQSTNIFEADRLRAVDFVIKPFTRDELLEAVHRAIS